LAFVEIGEEVVTVALEIVADKAGIVTVRDDFQLPTFRPSQYEAKILIS
jgi:hypothetical protein